MFAADDTAIFEVELAEGDVHHFDPLEAQDRLVAACKTGFNRALRERWQAFVALADGIEGPDGQKIQLSPEARDNAERQIARIELDLVAAGRAAFGFGPVDLRTGEGIPAAVVLGVVDAFVAWRAEKKSDSAASPGS